MLKKVSCIILVIMTSLSISETVVGVSAPFSFPAGIGIITQDGSFKHFVSLTSRMLKNGTILFTWSMNTKAEKGEISIYTLSGRLIKTFNVVSKDGHMKWDAKGNGLSNGIYFAVLQVGQVKQKIKFTILQ